jgi:hypothetical protein
MPNNLGPYGQPLNEEMKGLYGMIPENKSNNKYNMGEIQQIIPKPNPQPNPQPRGGKRKATKKSRKATRKARKAKRKTRK